MPINLANEKSLNKFIANLVYHGGDIDTFTAKDLTSKDYIENNKTKIVNAMTYQWLKLRVREYFTREESVPYLEQVTNITPDSPEWLVKAVSSGQKVFNFNPDNVPSEFHRDLQFIRDFFYPTCEEYINKELDKPKTKLKLDFLKTINEIDTFEAAKDEAQKWHDDLAKKAEKQQNDADNFKKSKVGTEFLMDLGDDYYAVQVGGPNMNRKDTETALDYESDIMGHCVGKGSYDENVQNGSIQIYSIRSKDGKPHCTFEVKDGVTIQAKGKANKAVKAEYIPYVQKFVAEKGIEVKGDASYIGYVRQDNKSYSLYDLPQGFVVKGDLMLSDIGLLKLPDMSHAKVNGIVNLKDNQELKSLAGLPVCNKVDITGCSALDKTAGKLPLLKGGIINGKWGDLSSYTIAEFLQVKLGTDWAEHNMQITEDGSVNVIGDLNLEETNITNMPHDINKLNVQGACNVSGNIADIIQIVPKCDKVIYESGLTRLSSVFAGLPILPLGIQGGPWGDLSSFSTKDFLLKSKGQKWFDANVVENDKGFLTVNEDLNLSGMLIDALPDDIWKCDIKGELNLLGNEVEQIKTFPKCKSLKLNKEYDLSNNFSSLPLTEDGIEFSILGDLRRVEAKEFLLKSMGKKAWAEKVVERDEIIINDDISMKGMELTALPQNMDNIIINGEFDLSDNQNIRTLSMPRAKKVQMPYMQETKSGASLAIPDEVEEITISNKMLGMLENSIKSSKLKYVNFTNEGNIGLDTLLTMPRNVTYRGNVVYSDYATQDYGRLAELESDDLSDLHIDGKFYVTGTGGGISLSNLPKCKDINLDGIKIKNPSDLTQIPSWVEKLDVRNSNIEDLSFTKSLSNLKEVKIKHQDNMSILKTMSPDVVLSTGFELKGEPDDDYSKYKVNGALTLRFNDAIKSLEKLPQISALDITNCRNLGKFAHQIPDTVKKINLWHAEIDDFSSLKPTSELEDVSIYENKNFSDSFFATLPPKIKILTIGDCNIQSFKGIENSPSLEKISFVHNHHFFAPNCLDAVPVETLKKVDFDGLPKSLQVRKQELVYMADYQGEKSDKLKKLNVWFNSPKNKEDNLVKAWAYYKVANELFDGKKTVEISSDYMTNTVKELKSTIRRGVSNIIMAAEVNYDADNDKAGRKVLDISPKNKSLYKRQANTGHKYIADRFGIFKADLLSNVSKHPEYKNAYDAYSKRLGEHISNLQTKLAVNINPEFNNTSKSDDKSKTSFNKAVKSFSNAAFHYRKER